MRTFLTILISFAITTGYCQTLDDIERLKNRIDRALFTDTVFVTDTVYDLLGKESEIIGYFKKDTLLKTITRFKNSKRIRIVYSWGKRYSSDNGNIAYIRDYDESTGKTLAEIFAKPDSLYLWNIVLQKQMISAANEDEVNSAELFLRRSDYSYPIEAKQVDNKAQKYDMLAELIETPINAAPPCGIMAYAAVLKFFVLESSDSSFLNKRIYLLKPCFGKQDVPVFVKGKKFYVHAATNSGATFGFSIWYPVKDITKDKIESLPKLWGRRFTPVQ